MARKISSNAPMPYFSVSKDYENSNADIYIFGDIAQKRGGLAGLLQPSSDQSSYDLANQISNIPEDWSITVHINSNGGELKEGLGIYNVLKARDVTTVCEGFAASAGSVIFCAGKKRIMQPASLLFIHQAHMSAGGNADDFEKAADDLRIVTEAAVAAYKECGITISDEELHEMLRTETWITPEEAISYGFATQISDEEPEDGVIVNDAMRSIMAAVKRPMMEQRASPEEGEVKEILDTVRKYEPVMEFAKKVVDALNGESAPILAKVKEVAARYADKAEEKKGFWGFR